MIKILKKVKRVIENLILITNLLLKETHQRKKHFKYIKN